MLLYYLRLITISFMKCLILDFRFYGFIVFVLIYKFIDGMVNKKKLGLIHNSCNVCGLIYTVLQLL